MFWLAVLGNLNAELLEIIDHLLESFPKLALEVFEVYEDAGFSRLPSFKSIRIVLNSFKRELKKKGKSFGLPFLCLMTLANKLNHRGRALVVLDPHRFHQHARSRYD